MFKVLAISAHPDDMEIEAGGTLAKMVDMGYEVHSLVLTRGGYMGVSGQLYHSIDLMHEARNAADIIGIKEVKFLLNHTTKLKADGDTIAEVDAYVSELKPDILLTLHQFDSHQDHRAAGEISLAIARQGRIKNVLCPIPLLYRPNSVAFRPQMFIDITNFMGQKLGAIKSYTSQYDKFGKEKLTDRVEAAAKYFGWGAGFDYAEAFEVIRMDDSLLRGNCMGRLG